MVTKAKLTIVLKADSTIVAESDDALLWQKVLGAIQTNSSLPPPTNQENPEPGIDIGHGEEPGDGDKAIARLVKTLGVTRDIVVGALSPSLEPPYLHLDHHCWAQMKKSTPNRGQGSLSP